MALDAAGNYLNSSFGINSVIALNDHPSIFPQLSIGLNLGWNISDNFTWESGIYNGATLSFDHNRFNLKHKLNKRKGYLLLTEGTYSDESRTAKIGTWYHTGEEDFGLWAMGQQRLCQVGRGGIDAFAIAAYSPKKDYRVVTNLMAGINGTGLATSGDVLGLAVSTVQVARQGWETALELNYRLPVYKSIYLSPDAQYIINPGATPHAADALVLDLRLGIAY